jgi:hypothetical protein
MLVAWWLWLIKISQLEKNSCLGEKPSIQILLGGWSDAPARYQPLGTRRFELIGVQTSLVCTPHVSLNSSALHSGSLKFDNIKGPYYSVRAKEDVIFRFWINKQFVDSGSCVVNLEQWTGFKDAVSICLSYCRDTILRGIKWSTGAGT